MKFAIIENWNTLTEEQKQVHRDQSCVDRNADLGTSVERVSLDGTKAVLKLNSGSYSKDQIAIEMSKPEWTEGGEVDYLSKRKLKKKFCDDLTDKFAARIEERTSSGDMSETDYGVMLADSDFVSLSSLLMMGSIETAYGAISAWTSKSWISDSDRDGFKSDMLEFLQGI